MCAYVPRWQLRSRFAAALSEMYGREVPAYNQLVEVSQQVNRDVLQQDETYSDQVIGDVERVSSERHGAIRVGSASEMRSVGRIFAVLGMYPVGFYDLREAARKSVPVVATCFRPIETTELDRHPFRVFTSMLVTDDRRFFDSEIQQRVEEFIEQRTLFSDELMSWVATAERQGGLEEAQAERFLNLACAAFELSPEPISLHWYETLRSISAVAADIGAEPGTHINHLTPRVLDIDELYRRMQQQGVEMIDRIQGPPSWQGPFVLLRQTSFRALDEERQMVDEQGQLVPGRLRVRFGEVEARGVALTPEGRRLYDELITATEERLANEPGSDYQRVAGQLFSERFPGTYDELARQRLAYFRFLPSERGLRLGPIVEPDPLVLLELGHVTAEPIVYEDFLPKSAAGIFQSNLTADGTRQDDQQGSRHDVLTLSKVLGRQIVDPYHLYQTHQDASAAEALAAIGYSAHALKRAS